jgi:glycosyltransferase involved in cell wall biosynthesis
MTAGSANFFRGKVLGVCSVMGSMTSDVVSLNVLHQHPLRGMSPPPLTALDARVSVVIPTLNEASNLPHVFARLPAGLHELIIVDGNSVDDTVEVARALRPGARIVMQTGRGKGDALQTGFAVCTGDIIVMIDADGSTDAAEITPLRRAGNRALNALVNTLYGTSYTDLCYGYNAFWARCLPYMRVDCTGFEVETLINIRIAKAGLTIHEVPSRERDRIHGTSNLHPVRDGTRVLKTIARERFPARSQGRWYRDPAPEPVVELEA